jgi:ATP-dependent RNA helicase DeaD
MTDTQGKPSADDPTDTATTGFAGLNLPTPLLKALEGLGYESPSPIQAQAIPVIAVTDLAFSLDSVCRSTAARSTTARSRRCGGACT